MLSADNARGLVLPDDDLVLPFRTVKSDVVGRVIRLGSVIDTVLSRHAYPEPVSHALGEALALTAMLGSALKVQARLILQTKTDGPLDFLVADFVAPGKVRGYASFDKTDSSLAEAKGRGDQGALLGKGHMAMTIDPGNEKDRYQGIVPLEGEPLVNAAHTYFRQSEQLPREGGKRGGAAASEDDDEENWNRARHLAATVEDHELLDPMLSPERLLYRLFHEEGVKVTPATVLAAECRCSRERIHGYLQRFGADELEDMREPDGGVTVTCEFCSRKYRFSSGDIG